MNANAVGTGQLKGCMLLANARLSNTKTPRQGKFAFRLNGSGSSTKQRHTALDGRTSRPGAGVWMALVWSPAGATASLHDDPQQALPSSSSS